VAATYHSARSSGEIRSDEARPDFFYLKAALWMRVGAITTAAAPASEGDAVVRSPTNMAAAKIAAVDFIG